MHHSNTKLTRFLQVLPSINVPGYMISLILGWLGCGLMTRPDLVPGSKAAQSNNDYSIQRSSSSTLLTGLQRTPASLSMRQRLGAAACTYLWCQDGYNRRREGSWGFLASQSSKIRKFRVRWEIVSQKITWKNEWGRCLMLTSVAPPPTNTHTHTQ